MCVCERWESERAPIRYFGDLGMLRGVTRGNRPRLSGGLCEEGGSWLQANVLHHDHSIAVHLFHVLLDLTWPWTYHSHFISLSTTVTHIKKKKQRAIKLAKPFGRASYIPALWECTLVSIMHSRGCFCDMGSPVLLPCDLWEASRRRGRNRNFGIWFFIVFLQRCGNIQQKNPLTSPGLLSLVYFYHAITLSTRNPCVLFFLCTHMFLKLSRGKDTPTRTTHTHRNTFTPQRLRAYEANPSTDTHIAFL